MSEPPIYTEYHPRWYRPRVSTYWWLKRGNYLLFILRELSSVFIAWFILFTLLQIRAVSLGGESYEDFQAFARYPLVVVVNAVSMIFLLLHAVTWFNLAPQAMVVRWRGQRVPGRWLVTGNFVLWALVSAVLAWIILGA
jgi:fumarate reductase subunit C